MIRKIRTYANEEILDYEMKRGGMGVEEERVAIVQLLGDERINGLERRRLKYRLLRLGSPRKTHKTDLDYINAAYKSLDKRGSK